MVTLLRNPRTALLGFMRENDLAQAVRRRLGIPVNAQPEAGVPGAPGEGREPARQLRRVDGDRDLKSTIAAERQRQEEAERQRLEEAWSMIPEEIRRALPDPDSDDPGSDSQNFRYAKDQSERFVVELVPEVRSVAAGYLREGVRDRMSEMLERERTSPTGISPDGRRQIVDRATVALRSAMMGESAPRWGELWDEAVRRAQQEVGEIPERPAPDVPGPEPRVHQLPGRDPVDPADPAREGEKGKERLGFDYPEKGARLKAAAVLKEVAECNRRVVAAMETGETCKWRIVFPGQSFNDHVLIIKFAEHSGQLKTWVDDNDARELAGDLTVRGGPDARELGFAGVPEEGLRAVITQQASSLATKVRFR